jgi:hypothetical protein
MKDLTLLYYTANYISEDFMKAIQNNLLEKMGDTPIISVSFKPINFGTNICVGELKRSAYNIYKQVLIAAKAATTEYVATAEDDVLYSREHYEYRPAKGVFAYDINKWELFSWDRVPVYTRKGRRNMTSLIVTREDLVKTLEERFAKYPVLEEVPERILTHYWGEPGRFENHLGIAGLANERYEGKVPHVMFCTDKSLAFDNLGTRKAHGREYTHDLAPWGPAAEVIKIYK